MEFPSSIWTTIMQVRTDPERVKDRVVRRYRTPVYEFIRRQGVKHEDGEDLTQEVFVRITGENFLQKIDPAKGKFRSLILAVTRHVIASWQRHQLAGPRDRRKEVAIADDAEIPVEAPPDAEFDQLWVKNLIEQAFERTQADNALAALKLQMSGKSYREIAAELSTTETDVTNLIHRAKQRLRKEVETLIREYSGTEDVEEEIASLLKLL